MSGRRGAVRGKARRATCPECGRDTAAMWNADFTAMRGESTYLLAPHNISPGRRCLGWKVGAGALTPSPAVQEENNA